jgi:hypothetical protein
VLVQGACVVPGGDRGRWRSRLRVGASVRRNSDNGQRENYHERFHGASWAGAKNHENNPMQSRMGPDPAALVLRCVRV